MRKVGENMADKEILEKLADECGGIFRTSDLAVLGYNTYAIRKMVDEQIIERIKQDYCKRCPMKRMDLRDPQIKYVSVRNMARL